MALDYSIIGPIFSNTSLLGMSWLIWIIASFMGCVIVSRNTEHWQIMLLPMLTGFWIIGIRPSTTYTILFGMIAAFMYVLKGMTPEGLGNFVRTIPKPRLPGATDRSELRKLERTARLKAKAKAYEGTFKDKKHDDKAFWSPAKKRRAKATAFAGRTAKAAYSIKDYRRSSSARNLLKDVQPPLRPQNYFQFGPDPRRTPEGAAGLMTFVRSTYRKKQEKRKKK